MQVQSFPSIKAASRFVTNFKRNGRKRQPVIVKTPKGVVACSRKTARKMTAKRGFKVVAI